jgi:hypothetical protein
MLWVQRRCFANPKRRVAPEQDPNVITVAQQLSAGVCDLLRGDGASTGPSWRHWKSIAGTGNSWGANIGMAGYENTFHSVHSHLSSNQFESDRQRYVCIVFMDGALFSNERQVDGDEQSSKHMESGERQGVAQ